MKLSVRAYLLLLFSLTTQSTQVCNPSGKIRGQKPPPACSHPNSGCCKEGKLYDTYKCSPPVSESTKAVLTLTSFEKNADVPLACDTKYYSDDTPLVALSTGWYNGGGRCLHNITISFNGRRVKALVVDECDSTEGCDADNVYQPPCLNNMVEASKGAWKALGVPQDDMVELVVTWSDP